MTTAARLEGIALSYGDTEVLRGVDLEVNGGEILALIGPSGCGKTSLLHVVMGLLAPTAGRVEVDGTRAMVFQKPQLLPWSSVVDNAAFGLACRGVARGQARARAEAMLAGMGLGDVVERRPHELSEGMQQRVNLARALLVEPEVLLMDEPYAALDVMTRERLWAELLAICEERSLTVLFASHDVEEVVVLADRVAVLGNEPTRVVAIEEVGLPRPRARGAALYERVTALRERVGA